MYIPLIDYDQNVFAIAQVFRLGEWVEFTDEDNQNALFFQENFTRLSHFFIDYDLNEIFDSDISHFNDTKLIEKLARCFECKTVEFWSYDEGTGIFSKYNVGKGFVQYNKTLGVVGYAMKLGITVSYPDVIQAPDYSPGIDGTEHSSLFIFSSHDDPQTISIVLRDKVDHKSFSAVDSIRLESVAPIIIKSLLNDINNNGNIYNDCTESAARLTALLEVAECLSGVLDIDVLIPMIMQRASSLLHTERCSLFLLSSNKKDLITRFHGGLDKSICLPLTQGIAGYTASTGNVVNITDAYNDPHFDKSVDMATGFKTRTILTVPIYDNRGEIAGVTEMINREDGNAFDEDDIKMMKAFNVFCGIALDNAKLYRSSLNMTNQLRSFVEMTTALNKTQSVRNVIEEILQNAKNFVRASRVTIFLKESQNEVSRLTPYVSIGEAIIHGNVFAKNVLESGNTTIFSRDDIIKQVQLTSDNKSEIEEQQLNSSRVSNALSKGKTIIFSSTKSVPELSQFTPLCDIPLIISNGKIIGVFELSCPLKLLPEDIKLLDCFAVFASVSLEKSELEEIAKFGHVESELRKYISENERDTYDIPKELIIPKEDTDTILKINFNSPDWDGIGHFKVIWYIFNEFNILKEFKIPNEKMFRFLSEISSTYNPVPYHNWRHAVDVTQFVSYQVKISKMDEKLTKMELFGLLVSAICHDANHDGFTNVYNVKAETPLGILFKNQSVMETHHCSISIGVLAKEENNILYSLSPTEFKQMWTLIIDLILITDMAKHFEFLKYANAEIDKGIDFEKPEHRLIAMKLILKCGDVSNVSRPFELANRWCDVLCEEFFRQGDLEMAQGMEYTSPLNDREHLDKPKSQIGFYTFVCLPLFQTTTRIANELVVNEQQIQSNLVIWKKEEQEKIEAEEREKKKNENENENENNEEKKEEENNDENEDVVEDVEDEDDKKKNKKNKEEEDKEVNDDKNESDENKQN
ncbi:3'5'-cyclic nucleotide phosphodiesterase family protein [Histomonas meleagridis]|uniref:3'5'-cyclic nucleotide phosphodiesterase family protein n=1 Tax=Histomonas meleagridis TaxID=135588 RepID=UPI00355A2D44|nr:3'5'-cyclic nucleotide phosphodiesterase family protein [Histomonas meleagridis]KAH0806215.1 3'5'-cyclic nucleotide phosphodiesterase family protein [Histomonas meleagridis]